MILQNDFKRQWQVTEQAVISAVRKVGESGWYILGKNVEALEIALTEFTTHSHAVGVGNGMDALEIGLRCLDLRPGEKVITTSLSAFATTLAIVRAGGVPVFVDVDDCGNIDIEQCRSCLSKDSSIRFLLPVHLYGNPVSIEDLASLKRDFRLRIVEDCAQAVGASDGETMVGLVGEIAGTSFYPTKNLGALGDGGALLTMDAALAKRAKALRNYGQSSLYMHDELGLNSRLDEIQAAILLEALLPQLAGWTKIRQANAAIYLQEIHHPSLRPLPVRSNACPVWHLYPVFVAADNRESLRQHLSSAGVTTGIHYPTVLPDQPVTASFRFERFAEPLNARRLAASEVSLPIHPFLTEDEVRTVISQCNSWVA